MAKIRSAYLTIEVKGRKFENTPIKKNKLQNLKNLFILKEKNRS